MFIGLLALCFSRSFWTGCTLASFLVCSVGWRRMDTVALKLKSAAQRFGFWCGHGRVPHFVVFVSRCWDISAPILPWGLHFWPKVWMLLLQMYLLCLCMEVCMFWQRFLQTIWEVDTVPSSWSTPCLISGCMKRCPQRTAASVLGSLDPFLMMEFVMNCLRGAETRDWIASRPA